MVFPWRLSDCKSPQVSSILAVFKNVVVWMVSTRLPTSKYARPFNNPFNNPLVGAKRTNHNWYYCHLHILQLFQFSSKVEVLNSFFTFFQFYSVVSRDSKVDNFADFFFLVVDYYKVWSSGRD